MRFLFCTNSLHGHDGSTMVAVDILRHLLASGHEVDSAILVETRRPPSKADELFVESSRKHIVHEHPAIRSPSRRIADRILRRLLPRRTGDFHFCPPSFYRAIAAGFEGDRHDAAIAITAKFSRLPELVSCPVVADLHELFTHKARTIARHGGGVCLSPFRGLAEEVDNIRRFDILWCPSSWIRRVLERLLPDHICIDRHLSYRSVVPDGYEPPPPRRDGPGRLLFAGSTARENVPGLLLFFREILPRIRERVPSVEFHVVGWTAADLPPGTDVRSAVLHGVLPDRADLLRLFAETDVVVIPRFLGGLTVKGVEALCLGKTTVGHPAAFSGCYRIESWKHAVVAGGPGEFAEAVIRLLGDPALRAAISRNAWEFSRRQFSPEVAYRDLFEGIEAWRRRIKMP